ncbi:MAG: hypothetical protein HFH41_07780 [Lachnospiraceae bacterium]|nr:hypothetical protein [Lachnospiraceae bacterium]
MILLKANDELKNVFGRMIKSMGANVTWTGNFVVLNHFLILSGNVRSLIFNFEKGKVITNVIELPDREEDMEPVADNETLSNVLNMTLYAFGKWGAIQGLKVEQDYRQLNGLFYAILKDIKVTPGFRDDNFRFYKNNVQITYEEVVQAALEEGKRKAEDIKEEKQEESQEEKGLGLWHKIRWSLEKVSFTKGTIGEYEKKASRLGNNFYVTGYQCPGCGRKMYMGVYPKGEEFPVETEEGRVYLARSYTCNNCNLFYTPRPGRLLREGDNYTMKFGGDREAYEDYLELLGSKAERTSNCNFNEFASERGKHAVPSLEEACADMEHMTEEELENLEEEMDTGFFPLMQTEPYREKLEDLIRKRKEGQDSGKKSQSNKKERVRDNHSEEDQTEKNDEKGRRERELERKQKEESEGISQEEIETPGRIDGEYQSEKKEETGKREGFGKKEKAEKKEKRRRGKVEKASGRGQEKSAEEDVPSKEKYDAHMKVLNRMSLQQLRGLRDQIQADDNLEWVEKEKYARQIKQAVYQKEEEEIRKKAETCKDKPYGILKRVIEEISQAECSETVKADVLEDLKERMKKKGKEEAEKLIGSVPEDMSRSQYQTFREKLDQYQDADISAYQEVLEGKRRLAEKRDIAKMLKRAERCDRNGLMRMLKQLKEDGFSKEQAEPAIEEITARVRAIDEKVIDKMCPNIMRMTFDEAAEAYEKVEGGPFLPELKTDTLEMIDKRLTKLKMDECELLVEKLKNTLQGKIKDTERLHFYEVRRIMRGEWSPREAELVALALNTYASERDRYEYPILVCDSSGKKNGKEGFVLTPDHIFYNSTFNSEMIPIRNIVGMEGNTGLLNRGIYINRGNGVKTKIPGGIPAKELKTFASLLGGFVSYLQEKPESRSIAYLAKEKHEVKCCYRCGYTYRGGNTCPKCGNQANH